jgi:CBS domain-containing protein
MIRVKSILERKGADYVSVRPNTTVLNALKLMAEKNIGSVIVLDKNDAYMGIVTERDYSRKVVLKDKHSDTTKVSAIMSKDLPQISPEDTIEHCMALFADKKVRYLPVFVKEKLAGIISMSDVVKEIIHEQKQTIDHLQAFIHS